AVQAVPGQMAVAEEGRQGPEGRPESAEEQRALNGVGVAGQVGDDEGRAHGEGRAGGLQAEAAQAQAGPGGAERVLEAVAGREGLGGQLGGGGGRLGGAGAAATGGVGGGGGREGGRGGGPGRRLCRSAGRW